VPYVNPLPPEALQAIGSVVHLSAQVDNELLTLAGRLEGTGSQPLVLLSVSFSQLARACALLADFSRADPEHRQRARMLIKTAESLQKRRNVVVHSAWQPDEKGQLHAFTATRSSQYATPYRDDVLSMDDLDALIASLRQLRDDIESLSLAILPFDFPVPLRTDFEWDET
jgi:hypothetical protein